MNAHIGSSNSRHSLEAEASPCLLVIDDEEISRKRLKIILSHTEESNLLKVVFCSSIPEALDVLSKTPVQVILLDKNLSTRANESEELPIEKNGIEAIPSILRVQPHAQIIIVTGSSDHQDAVRAMSLGASDFITKETPNDLLISRINRAIAISKISMSKASYERTQTQENRKMGGKSQVFREILRQAKILADTDRPVLILGETGTGKTALAKWIHDCRQKSGSQSENKFFHINMTALAENVLESELFGHERGAFTDAIQTRQGFFELANHGTLFLDEIGDASLDLQAKLLTVIESGEFYRLGGKLKLTTRAKLVFATNRNLDELVSMGKFREDLYMRISSFSLMMPSLDQRREDIPDIVRALLPKCCEQNHVSVTFKDLPEDFIDHLMMSPIRGNIRGIEHQLDRLLLFSPKGTDGKPILDHWRGIPGLYHRNIELSGKAIRSRSEITTEELLSLPIRITGHFPGLKEFVEHINTKILSEAATKYPRIIDLAQALKISRSQASLLVKQYDIARDRATRSPGDHGLSQILESEEMHHA